MNIELATQQHLVLVFLPRVLRENKKHRGDASKYRWFKAWKGRDFRRLVPPS